MVVHWCLDSSRRDKYIDEHKCIAEMADDEMRDVVSAAAYDVERLARETYGASPAIAVVGDLDASLTYVRTHMREAVGELRRQRDGCLPVAACDGEVAENGCHGCARPAAMSCTDAHRPQYCGAPVYTNLDAPRLFVRLLLGRAG